MKNEIESLEELNGKMISDIKSTDGDLWLKFTDNTFVVLIVKDITEGFRIDRNKVDICEYNHDNTCHILVELGIITEEEYKQACEKEEMEYEKRQEEHDKQEQERIRETELKRLEELRSKYNL